MRAHWVNAACGVLDYITYPLGMLILAPVILRRCGPAEYGLWTIATALVSTGAILASGFGDAGVRAIAAARAQGDVETVALAVRAMMTVHVFLGGSLGAAAFALSRVATLYLERGAAPQLSGGALLSLRFASALLTMRAVEAVCVSTQRAFERYGAALVLSVSGRLLSLAAAGVIAVAGRSVAWMLGGILLFQIASVVLQIGAVARRIGWGGVVPSLARSDVSRIVVHGRFTWLIAAAGVLFAYADRLLLGFSHGASSVAAYALCVQIAQPIHGLTANGLHFLFPYFARVSQNAKAPDFARIVRRAAVVNMGVAAVLCVGVGVFGLPLLRALSANAVEVNGRLLATVVLSFGLLSSSVVASYALVGIGRAREVGMVFGIGAVVMLGIMPVMLERWGEQGLASARLIFGLLCLLLYAPLLRAIETPGSRRVRMASASRFMEGGNS